MAIQLGHVSLVSGLLVSARDFHVEAHSSKLNIESAPHGPAARLVTNHWKALNARFPQVNREQPVKTSVAGVLMRARINDLDKDVPIGYGAAS